jgi:hypothetical protein
MSEEMIERGKKIAAEVAAIVRQLSDQEVGELLGTGVMDDLLKAILDPKRVKNYPNIAEFLLANKARASLLALVRHAITQNYSFKGGEKGKEGFVSPSHVQWFDDGVMFTEGQEPFTGLIGLYRNKELRYAVAARDARGGEELGKEDFQFVAIDELKAVLKAVPAEEIGDLERPLRELTQLLTAGQQDESEYQELIQKYPWILGAHYNSVQDLRKLDDENIPDFTGVRVRDNYRDIIEIKSPFMPILRQDGEFGSEFNSAWNQAERYLNFARQDKDYLRRKGLNFDLPRCYLILGYRLSDQALTKMRIKQSMNPAIEIWTYDDLTSLTERTVRRVRDLIRADGSRPVSG